MGRQKKEAVLKHKSQKKEREKKAKAEQGGEQSREKYERFLVTRQNRQVHKIRKSN